MLPTLSPDGDLDIALSVSLGASVMSVRSTWIDRACNRNAPERSTPPLEESRSLTAGEGTRASQDSTWLHAGTSDRSRTTAGNGYLATGMSTRVNVSAATR